MLGFCVLVLQGFIIIIIIVVIVFIIMIPSGRFQRVSSAGWGSLSYV